MKIYLAGPINGCTNAEANDWRSAVKRLHADVLDPMARDYRGKETEAVKEIVEGDKADIDACDGVLVWFERPSVGTSMEVLYAWERGKPVVVVNRSGKPMSPWLTYHAKAAYHSLTDAIAALNEAHGVNNSRKHKFSGFVASSAIDASGNWIDVGDPYFGVGFGAPIRPTRNEQKPGEHGLEYAYRIN